jgi:hypothetical protein
MAMNDIPGYLMGHRFSDDSADYDAVNKAWYDKGPYAGRGTDVTVTAGDPAANFTTVAAANNRRGVWVNNLWHAKMRCPIPWMGSVIVVVKPQNNSGTTTRTRYFAMFNNFASAPSNGYMGVQYFGSDRRVLFVTASSQVIRNPNRTDENTRVHAFATDQFTRFGYDTANGVTVNSAAAPASTTNGNVLALLAANEGVRIGNANGVLGDSTTDTSDFGCYLFEWHWFRGNILVGDPLAQVATEIAALKAYYGAS